MHPLPCSCFCCHRLVQCLVDISTATLLLLLPPPQPRLFLLLPPPHATISPQQRTIISLVSCAISVPLSFHGSLQDLWRSFHGQKKHFTLYLLLYAFTTAPCGRKHIMACAHISFAVAHTFHLQLESENNSIKEQIRSM